MCGIIGYVGKREAAPILLEGLRRLEYRGYDSAGLAVIHKGELLVAKKKGKIDEGLARLLEPDPLSGTFGIGHTRWATHGPPSDENSHPHLDQSGRIAVVHNGVIENFEVLKRRLLQAGHTFKSSTDTEVLAHLIGEHYAKLGAVPPGVHPLAQAVMTALAEVTGTYGIGVICTEHPGVLVGARRGSPLIVGVGDGENLLASDASALVAHTRNVIYLKDYEVATLTLDRCDVCCLASGTATVQISQLEFTPEAAEKGTFPHYMLKEIFEQPQTVRNALRGRIDYDGAMARFGGLNMSTAELRAIDRVVIAACGTSWHAGLTGEYLIEELAHVPVEVEYASEFRYRNAPFDKNTLLLVITQSGETLDTLAGLRETKRRGHKVLGICNVVGSTIAREADGGIYLHAGPEIGVASTKAFTSQVSVLTLFALFMGRIRMLATQQGMQLLRALEAIPDQLQRVLEQNERIRQIALKYKDAEDFLFLGRQYSFPVALEG
ncbi:MAG TPA: glutamine--fructose-6-phosphate transaminase (isomerizing), partial [Bacillota bacterium]|nr:glutamine--fructose-6-phosphate transaminase (isomerizing) [Bacillota bacterium]